MSALVKIAILEDLKEVAESLKDTFNEDPALSCAQVYHSAEEAMQFLPHNPADVLIVDIGLPRASGIEAIQFLSEKCPQMQFCMFTVFEDDDKIFDSLKAGAKGYILKRSGPSKVIAAVKDLVAGGSPMSPSIARRIIDTFQKFQYNPIKKVLPLSKRELELLGHLSHGLLYKEVAQKMDITIGTVKQYTHRIYDKLQVNNKTEALNKYLGK